MSVGKRFLLLSVLPLVACVSRAEIEEIKKGQKDILAKLDQIGRAAGAARPAPQAPQGPDPAKVYAFPVGQSAAVGPKDAWVTIVQVSDFQCPYCKRVEPTMTEIRKKYGNDVRIVWKHNALPFHNRAKPAAKAAECAGEQGKFWEMHAALFEGAPKFEDADLEGHATKLGLNVGAWKTCLASTKYDAKLDEDQKLANSLGARGTPAFFINGRYISGAQPLENFTKLIDEELAKAKASGLAKNDYYEKKVMTGQKAI